MYCPKCEHPSFNLHQACPACGFAGNPQQLEELGHLQYLLKEATNWQNTSPSIISDLYTAKLKTLEIELGLREPPPTLPETRQLRQRIAQHQALQQALTYWSQQGWLEADDRAPIQHHLEKEIEHIRIRLTDAPLTRDPRPPLIKSIQEHQYVLKALHSLNKQALMTTLHFTLAQQALQEKIEDLEIRAGLRPVPVTPTPVTPPHPKPIPPTPSATPPPPPKPKIPPKPPREPITWDAVWETLLSERTLRAVLFLGAILVFGGSVLWVIRNWHNLSTYPLIQIAILGVYTSFFYGLGWYVRTRLKLRESGIALSAVASLLLPLDFIVLYQSGGFPPNSINWVWLGASIVCLIVYTIATYSIQAELFGYLVGIAAGSTVIASLNVVNIAVDWWQLGLGMTALALVGIAEAVRARDHWDVFHNPFWHLGILGSIVAVILGMGFGFIGGSNMPAIFFFSLGLTWWVSGLVWGVSIRRYPFPGLIFASALAFPFGMWLVQQYLFDLWHISTIWYALGWALITPFYLIAGYALEKTEWDLDVPDVPALMRLFAQNLLIATGLLITISGLWASADSDVARWVHLLLAGVIVLAVFLWRNPVWLPAMTLLLITSSAAWQISLEANLSDFALSWSLLAILHILVGYQLQRKKARYDAYLYGGGLFTAALAILPALPERGLFIYAVANWIGMNLWLAYIAHDQENAGIANLLKIPVWGKVGIPVFHWQAALPALGWFWLLWTSNFDPNPSIAFAYSLIAWAFLGIGHRLKQSNPAYPLPWLTTAQLANIGAIALALAFFTQPNGQIWLVATLWSVTLFYWVMPKAVNNPFWLYMGTILLIFAWWQTLVLLNMPDVAIVPATALLVPIYMIAGMILTRQERDKVYVFALHHTGLILGGVLSVVGFAAATAYFDDVELLWISANYGLIMLGFGLFAWHSNDIAWASIAIGYSLVTSALALKLLSSGTGRSAIFMALGATGYILLERGLHHLKQNPAYLKGTPFNPFVRKAWHLFHYPLQGAGWLVSVVTIDWAVGRNLFILPATYSRQTWSIIALLIVTGLYALSARLYQKSRFVWLASLLVIVPWTLVTDLGWYVTPRLGFNTWEWHAPSWMVLSLLLLGTSMGLAFRFGWGKWHTPPWAVAQGLTIFALVWSTDTKVTTSWAFGLGIVFYFASVWLDRTFTQKGDTPSARFLYPAVGLTPTWALITTSIFSTSNNPANGGLVLLAFTLPFLLIGYALSKREYGYRLPFYIFSYIYATVATFFVIENTPYLIGVLYFNTGLTILSAYLFSEPLWLFVSTTLFPCASLLLLIHNDIPSNRFGWLFTIIAGSYMLIAASLRQFNLRKYSTPLIIMGFALVSLGLPFSSQDNVAALVGYGMAALVFAGTSLWLRQPILMTATVTTATISFANALRVFDMESINYGLVFWVGIGFSLVIAWGFDTLFGMENRTKETEGDSFPWMNPLLWTPATIDRVLHWWALPWYGVALLGMVVSPLFVGESAWRLTVVLVLSTYMLDWLTYRFRLHGWFFLTGIWAQLTILASIRWAGWVESPAQIALTFMPILFITAVVAVLLERFLKHVLLAGNPVTLMTAIPSLIVKIIMGEEIPVGASYNFKESLTGWSQSLFILLFMDIFFTQFASLFITIESGWVTLGNLVVITGLVFLWRNELLAYAPGFFAFMAIVQFMLFYQADPTSFPIVIALLAMVYGIMAYGMRYWQQQGGQLPAICQIWYRPFQREGTLLSGISLLGVLLVSPTVLYRIVDALFGGNPVPASDMPEVQMVILVFAILGLMYLLGAIVERQRFFAYGSLLLLLSSWSLWLLLVGNVREMQLYAVPAGIYLLGISWLEWTNDNRNLSKWMDRLAIFLLLGTLFWQSFGDRGAFYALLMILEGLFFVWYGSLRRIRRLLYAGVIGVVLSIVGQLVEPLSNLNSIVLTLLGMFLLGVGVFIQQRLEKIRLAAQDLFKRLEHWD